MKTQRKNITEEIERMKTLFTEERLYGNLVEQLEDEHGVVDDNLDNDEDGDEITVDAAIEILNKKKKEGKGKIKMKALWDEMKSDFKKLPGQIAALPGQIHQAAADAKEKRQGFAHMTTKEKADAMRTQKTTQRDTKKEKKNNLAACNRGMKALQKYFLSNPNPNNRMTIETFKGNITGPDFKSRQDKVTGCTTTFKGQLKTDKEVISNKTVTEWITDIIIGGNNNHIKISKEAIKGTVGKGQQIKIKNVEGKNIGIITPTETKNQYKLTGGKKRWFILKGTQTLDDLHKRYILKAMKMPKASITVVPNTPAGKKIVIVLNLQ